MNGQLAELARLYGIQTSFKNMRNKRQEAQPETVLLTLAALGAAVRRMEDVPKALTERKRSSSSKNVEPVIVAWDGEIAAKDRRLPKGSKGVLVGEDGREYAWPPRRLPHGYYTLHLGPGGATETLVIAAPAKAHFPFTERTWGAFAPVYALDSARGRAAGDLTDFESFADWILALGGRVAATLPLLAGYLEDPFDPSPYAPVSRLFWNEFYADPRRIAEYQADDGETRDNLDLGLIDYRHTMTRRRSTLETLAQRFFEQGSSQRRAAFEAFRRANPGLDDYARFRAVVDRKRSEWPTWPAPLRDGVILPTDYDKSALDYHRYAQWVVQEQLGAAAQRIHDPGGALYLDMPLGLHRAGFDTWRYPGLFVRDMGTGAPPDPAFTQGQHWGFPPLDPHAMRKNRYQYTIAGIRNHLKYAKLLRIDRVMGLHRQYWIPDGVEKSQGVFVEYPAEELYAILCLESHRHGAGFVGENLGIVPAGVRNAMRRHNIQQLYALQYEIVGAPGSQRLRTPPREAVACLNTHDMPPFRAFLDGRDIADRIRLGFLDEETARHHRLERSAERRGLTRFLRGERLLDKRSSSSMDIFRASTQYLGASPARVALINVEDLWQETDPQNVPATSDERPNWRRRLKRTIEEVRSDSEFTPILENMNNARRRTRKLSHPAKA